MVDLYPYGEQLLLLEDSAHVQVLFALNLTDLQGRGALLIVMFGGVALTFIRKDSEM